MVTVCYSSLMNIYGAFESVISLQRKQYKTLISWYSCLCCKKSIGVEIFTRAINFKAPLAK